ncbi:MAG: HK97 gp10 family phage protein [Rhodocyclaceae bacterium]|nr:HK97 gp10 family phage protein [Rhodocyclaceae bacterium]
MKVSVEVGTLEQLRGAFAAAPEIAHDELSRFMAAATAHLQGEVQQRTPTHHGTLRGSIIGRVQPLAGGLGVEGVVGTSLAYAIPVELGTKPHMPPIEPLVDWARSKLGLSQKEARSAAWGIAGKIARRGTQGARMFGDSLDANRAQLAAGFERAVRRILTRIAGRAQ